MRGPVGSMLHPLTLRSHISPVERLHTPMGCPGPELKEWAQGHRQHSPSAQESTRTGPPLLPHLELVHPAPKDSWNCTPDFKFPPTAQASIRFSRDSSFSQGLPVYQEHQTMLFSPGKDGHPCPPLQPIYICNHKLAKVKPN